MKSCKICGLELIHPRDIFLVFGSSEFRPIDAIVQLPFIITGDSPYVCKQCKGSLKSWMQARDKAHKIEEELKGKYDLVSQKLFLLATLFNRINLRMYVSQRRNAKQFKLICHFQLKQNRVQVRLLLLFMFLGHRVIASEDFPSTLRNWQFTSLEPKIKIWLSLR